MPCHELRCSSSLSSVRGIPPSATRSLPSAPTPGVGQKNSGIRAKRTPAGTTTLHCEKHFREAHWETDDIDQLAEVTFDPYLCAKRRAYEGLTKKYVAVWRAEDARYFEVQRAEISLGELIVTVDGVIGMRTDGAEGTLERAFILWLSKDPFASDILNVSSYLLWLAAEHAPWPRQWRLGIWDVGCSNLLDAVSPLDGTEELVHRRAAEFVERTARTFAR